MIWSTQCTFNALMLPCSSRVESFILRRLFLQMLLKTLWRPAIRLTALCWTGVLIKVMTMKRRVWSRPSSRCRQKTRRLRRAPSCRSLKRCRYIFPVEDSESITACGLFWTLYQWFILVIISLDLGYGVLCDVCVHSDSVSFSCGYGGCGNRVWRKMGYETHSFIYIVVMMTANS